jgi:AcrR family transcriptional regulator
MTATSPDRQVERTLRADARRNYDLLVAAAHAEFTRHGATASLEDIARRAGVGIGTLYRHFPTRDDLIARVLEEGTQGIVERGRARIANRDPAAQLAAWIAELVDYVTTYRGLTGALANSYVTAGKTQLCAGCEAISETGAALLARAQEAGQIRSDAEIKEVILSAHAAAWIAEQTKDPGAVERMLGILFDGLRSVRPSSPPARASGARRGRAPRAAAKPARDRAARFRK